MRRAFYIMMNDWWFDEYLQQSKGCQCTRVCLIFNNSQL